VVAGPGPRACRSSAGTPGFLLAPPCSTLMGLLWPWRPPQLYLGLWRQRTMPRTWPRALEGTTTPRLRPWALPVITALPGPTRVRRRAASQTCPRGRRRPRASRRRPPMPSTGRPVKVRMAAGCTQLPQVVGHRGQSPCHRPCPRAIWCYRWDTHRCCRCARNPRRISTHNTSCQVQRAPQRGAGPPLFGLLPLVPVRLALWCGTRNASPSRRRHPPLRPLRSPQL